MNNSSEVSDQFFGTNTRSSIQVFVWLASGIWTACANGVILVCFYKNRRRQWTGFSRQVCSMTVGDFVSGCVLTQYLTMQYYLVPASVCSISVYLLLATQCVSFFHVLGVCIFRNLRMKNLTIIENQSQNFRISLCIISAAWILSFLFMLIPIALWAEFSSSMVLCSTRTIFGTNHPDVMIYIASFYCLSQVLTNVIYFVAVYRLRTKIRQIIPKSSIGQQPPSQLSTTSKQTTSTSLSNKKSKNITSSFVLHSSSSHQPTTCDQSSQVTQGTCTVSGRLNSGSSSPVSRKLNPGTSRSQPAMSILKNYRGILVTTGFVLLVFDIFTLPFTISFFATFNSPASSHVRFIGLILLSVNSSINPIVYATRITSIKMAVKKLFNDCIKICHGDE